MERFSVLDVDQQPEEVEEARSESASRWPFSIARAFSYTRMLESRIEELEEQLEDAQAYITHLANMGLAMRGIPAPTQQKRKSSASVHQRPVTMSAIRAKRQQQFRERHDTQDSSSQRQEQRVIDHSRANSSDQSDIQDQINSVVAMRNGHK